MRIERMIQGLNNKQAIRFMVDGFAMYTTVQGLLNIASTQHRVAVWSTLEKLALSRADARRRGSKELPTGLAWTIQVHNQRNELQDVQVQVDLCDQESCVFG